MFEVVPIYLKPFRRLSILFTTVQCLSMFVKRCSMLFNAFRLLCMCSYASSMFVHCLFNVCRQFPVLLIVIVDSCPYVFEASQCFLILVFSFQCLAMLPKAFSMPFNSVLCLCMLPVVCFNMLLLLVCYVSYCWFPMFFDAQ